MVENGLTHTKFHIFGNDYLQTQYKDKWSIGNVQSSIGSGLGKFAQSLGVDYPSNPKFTIGMTDRC